MSIVKQIASNLINIHGQHDNQQLFTPSKHISFIDGYANLTQNVEQYKKIYAELTDVRGKLNSFNEDIELKARKAELLQFQIDEIESAELTDGEEEELLNRRDLIKNSESLPQCISIVHDLLIGSDDYDGAIASVRQISNNLADISEYLNDFKDVSERANSISYELEEIEERTLSLTKIVVLLKWESHNNVHTEHFEFGCSYQQEDGNLGYPWKNNGAWVLIPWKIQGLYK